jgi:hypothetical protein
MTSENDEKVVKAADLFRLVPASNTSFSYADALVHVGVASDMARTETLRNKFNYQSDCILQRDGPPRFDNSDYGKVKRAKDIMHLLPELSKADLFKLAGWTNQDLYVPLPKKGPSKLYMQVQRAKAKLDKERRNNPAASAHPAQPPSTGPPPVETPSVIAVHFDSRDTAAVDLLSPLSAASDASPTGPPTSSAQPSVASRSTASSNTRLTSRQRQEERRVEAEQTNNKKYAFKLATFLYKTVKDGENSLKKFQSADRIATEINDWFGILAVSGRQIADAFAKGRAGQSPPCRGAPSLLPEEDVKDLAMLCFSLSAIEQANCAAERLDSPGLVSLVGKIINEKRKSEGLAEIDEVHIYRERIQQMNAAKQTVGVVDERDASRVKWTTASNQRRHYERWEEACVRLGFARMPIDEHEKQEKGYVVFYDGQEHRIANFDEMKLALDGTDENAGGRPSATPMTNTINESGKPAQKTAKSLTLMLGIIGDEPTPPLAIHLSQSGYIAPQNIASFHEIEAQYGLSTRRHFLPSFASSPKGGMNKNIFRNWMLTQVLPLWPDLADLPGRRVVLKADSGPGRMATEFLAETAVEGMYFFPGLPNATEIGQEMDQLFAAFKTCAYKNRDKLYRARVSGDGADAILSFEDVGYIIFGGKVQLSNGTELELEPAFTKYFSPEHVQAAREKCGYFPATRNALKSDRIRHEIVEDEDGNIGDEDGSYALMLDELEQQNHRMVDKLVGKGYALPQLGKRNVQRITARQTEGRAAVRTEPSTRERQDLLMKCSRAGHFFEITDGGGVLNSADMLLSRERKEMLVRAEELEKTKKRLENYTETCEDAVKVFNKPYKNWLKEDFKVAFKYKQGPNPPKGEAAISTWGKGKLKKWYDQKYKNKTRESRWEGWTEKQQAELERLKRGDIESVKETMIYGRALQTQIDYLVARMRTISVESRMKVWKALADILPPDEKVKISNVMNGAADPASTESFSCEEEESEDDDSSLDTLVEIEIDDDAASEVAGSSSSDSSDESNTGTTQVSLPSDEDPIDVGDLDDGSLGSSGDPNLYCSVGNSGEESSDNESTDDDEEGNESITDDNASPTLTEEQNESTEEDDNASPTLIEEDNASTADDNDRLESRTNEVEDAQENQVRRSTRIRTRRG